MVYGNPSNVVIVIRISVHHRLEFDIPKYVNAIDGGIGLFSANLAERSLEDRISKYNNRPLETIAGTGRDEGQALNQGLGLGWIEWHL